MKLDIRNWFVSVVTDLYHVAFDNDGSPYHAECYYVVIERPDGKRLAHSTTFFGCKSYFDGEDDLIFFTDIREEARKGVERLEARVKAVGSIDTAYWNEVSPAYGSEYYSKTVKF